MSLDTVLQIGKALRSSKGGLRHFKYIKPCPKDTDKESILRLNIPVKDDFSFDWNNVNLVPENQIDSLFYLTFKTSDADGFVKYIFGDIYFELNSKVSNNGDVKVSEGGYYRLPNENSHGLFKKSSFQRGDEDFEALKREYLKKNDRKLDELNNWQLNGFRNSFFENESVIEKILRNIPSLNQFFSITGELNFSEFVKNDELMDEYHTKYILRTVGRKDMQKVFGADFELKNDAQHDRNLMTKLGGGKIFLHFDFHGAHWYEFEPELDLITEKMLGDFFEQSEQGYVLKKTLYKTLCSGDKKNDIQFPGLAYSSKHKSKYFSENDAKDLFYAKEYSEKALFTIRGTEIKVIVLPRGENLKAIDYEEFLEKANERRAAVANQESNTDQEPLFVPFSLDDSYRITAFDFVFSKKGGLTSPDSDLIELSGIEKSSLKATMERINQIGDQIKRKYVNEYRPKIELSFLNILGSPQSDSKTGKVKFKTSPKYQSHILKVLPQVYSQNYHQDEILLPAFIEKIEFSIRNGDQKDTPWYFKNLKYYLEFLLSIQNNQTNRYMEITNSRSYQTGLLLGSLAKGLKNKINSFEKNYVGNLTRRISTLSDCRKFKNEIEQKNIMHELSHFTRNTSNELSAILRDFKESDYDKEEVAFGFFESYFRYETKKGFIEKLEKLLTDYASNDEEDVELVQEINAALENYQTR